MMLQSSVVMRSSFSNSLELSELRNNACTEKVIGNVFLSDHCSINYVCTPGKYTEERGNRHMYKVAQNTRRDSSNAGKKPAQVYLDTIATPLEADNAEISKHFFWLTKSI
ncbi:hypothetical protein V3C99_018469 [Haemonchus contortus]